MFHAEFKIDLLPTSDETSTMSTTHLHSFEALIEELLDPESKNTQINLYDDDMDYGSDDLKKDLKKELPAGFDLSSSGSSVKVKRKFTGPGLKNKSQKEFKDPGKRRYEKNIEKKRKERGYSNPKMKPKLKILKSVLQELVK